MGREDLYFLCKEILGYEDVTIKPHEELVDFIQNCERRRKRKLLILEPRGSFKTSVVTIGLSIKTLLQDPNKRILITNENLTNAKAILAEIKDHFEKNEEFCSLYGDWSTGRRSGTWTSTHIKVRPRTSGAKEHSVTAAGVNVTKVSMHYDLIIADDLVSEKTIATTELLKKTIKYYKLLLSLLEPKGTLIIIGTRWHYGDLYGYLLEREKARKLKGKRPRFEILSKSAVLPDGSLLFPTRLTKAFLADRKDEQGPFVFSCQYLNDPQDDESAEFKKSWLKFYRKRPKVMNVFLLADPGGAKKGDDYNAWLSVGITPKGDCHAIRGWRGYCNPKEFCDRLLDEVIRLRSFDMWPIFLMRSQVEELLVAEGLSVFQGGFL